MMRDETDYSKNTETENWLTAVYKRRLHKTTKNLSSPSLSAPPKLLIPLVLVITL